MSLLSFEDALSRLLAGAQPVSDCEQVGTLAACGRVLAVDVKSTIAVPSRDVSMMDGYCLRTRDIEYAGTRLAVTQRIPAGSVGSTLEAGTAARIFTGAPIPPGADAVVMQELCAHQGETVTINHVPHSGEWITRAGADIASGAVVLAAGSRIRPQDAGLAASVGCAELKVFRRLRVALFSTGSELVMPGQALPEGALYNSNRYLLRALLEALGCEVRDLGIVPDQLAATRAALREAAAEADLVVTSGGVSVGEEDHVRPAVEAEGRLDLWKIALKPGKPLAFGSVAGAAFIGLPGNPVSSFVTFLTLVRPFVLRSQGAHAAPPRAMALTAAFDWDKPDARREFLRARRDETGSVTIFANQSSAVLTSTAWADGLVDNAPGHTIRRGETVSFIPFSELLA